MVGVGNRVVEVGGPMRAGAERLVLRVAAPAEAAVLERRAGVARNGAALGVDDGDAAGEAVRPVLRDLDRRRPRLVDLCGTPTVVEGEAEGARGAGSHHLGDLVHPGAARGDERVGIRAEHRPDAVAAETRVGARPPVVQDGERKPRVDILAVRRARGILGAGEADAGVAAVAERLRRRRAAAAERHQRARGDGLPEPVVHCGDVRGDVRPVVADRDLLGYVSHRRAQRGEEVAGCVGSVDRQVLQRGGRFAHRGLGTGPGCQVRGLHRHAAEIDGQLRVGGLRKPERTDHRRDEARRSRGGVRGRSGFEERHERAHGERMGGRAQRLEVVVATASRGGRRYLELFDQRQCVARVRCGTNVLVGCRARKRDLARRCGRAQGGRPGQGLPARSEQLGTRSEPSGSRTRRDQDVGQPDEAERVGLGRRGGEQHRVRRGGRTHARPPWLLGCRACWQPGRSRVGFPPGSR